MNTKKWGKHIWKSIHFLTYPYKNKKCNLKNYKIFFDSLGYILPCIYCRNSYKIFCQEQPLTLYEPLDIFYWTYCIHNKVNDKLRNQGNNIPPNPSFKKIQSFYNNLQTENCQNFINKMIYFITFNYANNPNPELKKHYMAFFWSLLRILPNNQYKINIKKMFDKHPIQNYLKNANDLFYWAYLITNNKKTFKQLKKYYSKFNASKCSNNYHKLKYSNDNPYKPSQYTLIFN